MLKAVLMDFDGVIVDTESVWFEIYQEWFKTNYQYELTIQDYLTCVGANSTHLFQFLENELSTTIDQDQFNQDCTDEFVKKSSSLPLMDGVISFIKDVKNIPLKLSIATSATLKKPFYHLKRHHLLDEFDTITSAELVTNIKPAPDLFLKSAEILGVNPSECLVIEDSKNGMIAAQAAGMKCIFVPNRITTHEKVDDKLFMMKVQSLKDININCLLDEFKQ